MQQQNPGVVEDFIFTLFRSLSTNPKVKELLKSVHICQSYLKNKSGTFFVAHGVDASVNSSAVVWREVKQKGSLF